LRAAGSLLTRFKVINGFAVFGDALFNSFANGAFSSPDCRATLLKVLPNKRSRAL
jgi:hypothetical protein